LTALRATSAPHPTSAISHSLQLAHAA
jgi:hypothetical protein